MNNKKNKLKDEMMISSENNYNKYISLWRIALYSTITLGIYDFFWKYNSWKLIQGEKKENINPGLRTFLTLIPIICFFMDIVLFKKLIFVIKNKLNLFDYLFVIFLVLFYTELILNWYNPMPQKILYVLRFLPLLIMQFKINNYFMKGNKNG